MALAATVTGYGASAAGSLASAAGTHLGLTGLTGVGSALSGVGATAGALGGAVGTAAATSGAAAGTSAAGALGLGGMGMAFPLLGIGLLAAGLFRRKKPLVNRDGTNFDRQDDWRSDADKAYSPMFMTGQSTAVNPQLAYSQPYRPITVQDRYANQGVSGFGMIKGFGGMGGGTNFVQPSPATNMNWTGFTTPLTNYGRKGITGLTAVNHNTGGYQQRAPLLEASKAGYQLRM